MIQSVCFQKGKENLSLVFNLKDFTWFKQQSDNFGMTISNAHMDSSLSILVPVVNVWKSTLFKQKHHQLFVSKFGRMVKHCTTSGICMTNFSTLGTEKSDYLHVTIDNSQLQQSSFIIIFCVNYSPSSDDPKEEIFWGFLPWYFNEISTRITFKALIHTDSTLSIPIPTNNISLVWIIKLANAYPQYLNSCLKSLMLPSQTRLTKFDGFEFEKPLGDECHRLMMNTSKFWNKNVVQNYILDTKQLNNDWTCAQRTEVVSWQFWSIRVGKRWQLTNQRPQNWRLHNQLKWWPVTMTRDEYGDKLSNRKPEF